MLVVRNISRQRFSNFQQRTKNGFGMEMLLKKYVGHDLGIMLVEFLELGFNKSFELRVDFGPGLVTGSVSRYSCTFAQLTIGTMFESCAERI